MKLKDYLTENRFTAAYFARTVGVHPETIRSVLKGSRNPSYRLAMAIEEITEGAVTAQELLEDTLQKEVCPCCKRVVYGKNVAIDRSVLKE